MLRRVAEHQERCHVGQIRSRTPSTTWAVVDFRVSQVFSPAWRTVSRLPLAALMTLDFVLRFDAAFFFAGLRFLEEERFADLRFLPAVRFVDFLVAAI